MFEHNDNWEWIWLLAAVALVGFASEVWRCRMLRQFAGQRAAASMRGPLLKRGIFVVAELLTLLLLVAALADPRWGFRVEQFPESQTQLVFAVDVSRSMSATDAPPSRLERAKSLVANFLNELGGERVALVDFAGNARTAAPLTQNYSEISTQLEALQVSDRLVAGSELKGAFQAGCDAFLHRMAGDKLLIVLTDGEDHGTTEPAQIASIANECDCRTMIVGLGDPVAGSRIFVAQTPTGPQYLMYKGEPVVTRRNDELLTTLASLTDGVYLPANNSDLDLAAVYREHFLPNIDDVSHKRTMRVAVARFPWFLAAALLVLLCRHGLQRGRRVGPHLRLRLPTPAYTLAAVAALAIGLGASVDDLIRRANRDFRAGRFDEAIAGFEVVATLNQQSALPRYNQAVVYYRSGDRVAARDKLQETLVAGDDSFSSRCHFLLGNCDYADVVAGGLSKKDAVARLQSAIGHYRRALDSQPDWKDPRVNIELAHMLIEQIEHAPELPQNSNEGGDEGKKGGRDDGGSSSDQSDQSDASGMDGKRSGSQPQGDGASAAHGSGSTGAAGGESAQTGGTDGTQESRSSDATRSEQNSSSTAGRNPDAKAIENSASDRDDVERRLNQILQKSRNREAGRKSNDGRQTIPIDKDW